MACKHGKDPSVCVFCKFNKQPEPPPQIVRTGKIPKIGATTAPVLTANSPDSEWKKQGYYSKSDDILKAFDIVFYRGEKSQWWPPPAIRVKYGLTLYGPWTEALTLNNPGGTAKALWTRLAKEISNCNPDNPYGNPNGYAQYLRATGRPFALATARSTEGSFTSDYNYTIEIKQVRTFYFTLKEGKIALGGPAPFGEPEKIDREYVVLNADTVEESTILGFGHVCGTNEVTFLHELKFDCVLKVKGVTINNNLDTEIKNLIFQKELEGDEEAKYGKLWRMTKPAPQVASVQTVSTTVHK